MARLLGRLGQMVCALALAAGAGAGCDDGGDEAGRASRAPPDAPLYAEVAIRPDDDQADAIESFAERVGGTSDPGKTVIERLNEFFAAAGADTTYAEDVEP